MREYEQLKSDLKKVIEDNTGMVVFINKLRLEDTGRHGDFEFELEISGPIVTRNQNKKAT